jgi:hypothetical protein
LTQAFENLKYYPAAAQLTDRERDELLARLAQGATP